MFQTKNTFKRMMHLSLLASVGFAALLLVSAPALAATAPLLGAADSFSVLAGSEVTNTGATTISGDVGISPGIGAAPHFSGFGTVTLGGSVHDADLPAANAQADSFIAYGALDQPCDFSYVGAFKELAGENLLPGVHCATSFHLTSGTLTLNGLASDVWIFKSASDLIITGGAPAQVVSPSCSVWWRVVSTATFDADSSLIGNILADTSITLAAGASLSGRAFARTAEVTLSSNTISACLAALATPTLSRPGPLPGVTLGAEISDTKTLSGGTNPGGTITFRLYGPNDADCTLGEIFTSIIPVSDNGVYSSGLFTPLLAGTYRWIATYSGDGSNAPSATLCNDPTESVVVTAQVAPAPTAVPTLNEWGVIIFMVLVGLMSIYYLRRQKAKA